MSMGRVGYGPVIRAEAVEAVKAGESSEVVAARMGLVANTVSKWVRAEQQRERWADERAAAKDPVSVAAELAMAKQALQVTTRLLGQATQRVRELERELRAVKP